MTKPNQKTIDSQSKIIGISLIVIIGSWMIAQTIKSPTNQTRNATVNNEMCDETIHGHSLKLQNHTLKNSDEFEALSTCKSVEELVAAAAKYPKVYKKAGSIDILRKRVLYMCQDHPEYKPQPICQQALSAPNLVATQYLSVKDGWNEIPVPLTVNGKKLHVNEGTYVEVLQVKGELTKVKIVSALALDETDLGGAITWVPTAFVKTELQ
jgi:hypothetical protein